MLEEVAPDAYTSRARAAFVRGLACFALGREREGVADLRRALEADDLDVSGVCTYLPGAFGGVRLDDLPAAVPYTLAREAFRAGLFAEALVGCEQLYDRASRLLHGCCLEELGRWAEARAQYLTAQERGAPEAVEALLALEKRVALLAPKATSRATTTFDIGKRVAHAKLGTGEVVDVEDGNAPRALVAFESGAEKWVPVASVRSV